MDAGATRPCSAAPPPEARRRLFYYEVELKTGGDAGVRRYQASTKGGTRKQIAFPLTHETLAKLAANLAADA